MVSPMMPAKVTTAEMTTTKVTATEMTTAVEAGIMQPRGSVAVEPRFNVAHVAESVLHIANLPLDTNVQFMTIMATNMPFIGRG